MVRPLVGSDPDYYTFDTTTSAINLIAAAGSNPTLLIMGIRGGSALMLVELVHQSVLR